MSFSTRQRHALEEICDVICPPANGAPTAREELGVADAHPCRGGAEPAQVGAPAVRALLSLWDTHALGALGGAGFHRFSSLPREQREQVLLSWGDSRSPQRRAAFQALRKGALLFYYMLPGPAASRSPVWDAIGYPGPLGAPSDAPPKALTPLAVDRDTRLDCDVCSSARARAEAPPPACSRRAGLDVVVLEAGDYYDDADFDGAELDGYSRMYLNGGGAGDRTTRASACSPASCLGGGTVVNYSTSFRTPDDVRAGVGGARRARRSPPTSTRRASTRSASGSASTRSTTLRRPATRSCSDGLRRARLARRLDAAQRPRLRPGRRLRLLRATAAASAPSSRPSRPGSPTPHARRRAAGRAHAGVRRVIVEGGAARGVEAATLDGHARDGPRRAPSSRPAARSTRLRCCAAPASRTRTSAST